LVLEDVPEGVHPHVGRLDEHHEQPVRATSVHHCVERPVASTGLLEVSRCFCSAQQRVLTAHRGEVGALQVWCREPGDLALQQGGSFDGLTQLPLVEIGHASAGPAGELHQAFGLEPTERLANGHDAHLQLATHIG
jgi:hypothetical protein